MFGVNPHHRFAHVRVARLYKQYESDVPRSNVWFSAQPPNSKARAMPPDKCALYRETDPFKWTAEGRTDWQQVTAQSFRLPQSG